MTAAARNVLVVRRAADLDRPAIERVAFTSQELTIAPELLAQVDVQRESMMRDLASGGPVYGVNTGMGYLSTVALDPDQQASHSRRLLLGRAVGSAPWLPREEVRALMVVRLVEFLRGRSGVSSALCRYLAERLNDDFCPAVPAGGMGAAGEIQPLAHAFQTLVGVGRVLDGSGEGTEDAAAALGARGAAPYVPGLKEGLALLAGAPAAAGLTLARLRRCRQLSDHAMVVAAHSAHAIGVPRGPFDPIHGELAGDAVLGSVLRQLGALLGEPDDASEARDPGHQAPVSFRVFPQVLAHLRRTADRVTEDVDRHLGAVTDSPVYVDHRFVTSGAFHAIDLAAGLDHLAIALTHAAELSAQRIHRLMDVRVTGLPPQLTPMPGAGCGLIVVHKRAVGVVNELRRLASPASIGISDTSLGQEDAQTFTFEAAGRLRRVEELVTDVLACEVLCGRQARWLADTAAPAGLRHVAAALDDLVPPVAEDRPLGEDLDRLVDLLNSDGLPRPDSRS